MEINYESPIIKDMKEFIDNGYRCIYYEIEDTDNMFTVYLKNFSTEKVKVLKCEKSYEGEIRLFIDQLT